MKNMKGKICLITGGTNGIGKVTAQELAQMGTTVVIVGRNAEKTARVVAEIRAATGNENVDMLNALHPGLVNTGFGKNNSGFLMKLIGAVVPFIARSPEKGAETSIYLAASPDVHIVTGKYFVDSKVAQAAAQAADPTVAKKLWDVSSVLVKLTDTMPAAV